MKLSLLKISAALFCLSFSVQAGADGGDPQWGTGTIGSGQCLYCSLQQKRLASTVIAQITNTLRHHMDFRHIRVDTPYRYALDASGRLQDFTIETDDGLLDIYLDQDVYRARRIPADHHSEMAAVNGCCMGADQKRQIYMAGEASELSDRFRELLMHDLEGGVELIDGDQFRLVVEKQYSGNGLFRYGPIQALEVCRGDLKLTAVRYKGEYYDETGCALKSRFLRFPLAYRYVSSQFQGSRRHPILGGLRPHKGVDIAAPVGVSVSAIADGEVKTAAWLNGYGRTVVLIHGDGYESLYAHLSKFGPHIKEGATVHRREVIGKVGMTGLTTGPHLHFGLTRYGVQCDPLKEDYPRAIITDEADLAAFMSKKERLASILYPVESAPILTAEMPKPGPRH